MMDVSKGLIHFHCKLQADFSLPIQDVWSSIARPDEFPTEELSSTFVPADFAADLGGPGTSFIRTNNL